MARAASWPTAKSLGDFSDGTTCQAIPMKDWRSLSEMFDVPKCWFLCVGLTLQASVPCHKSFDRHNKRTLAETLV